MSFLNIIRKLTWKVGLDVQRFDQNLNFDNAHGQFLRRFDIDLTLDVGANIGQFGRQLRNNYGYTGEIISFEPLSSARILLEREAARDPEWKVMPYALGDGDGMQQINISGNSQSSSLLKMEGNHLNAAPASKYVGTEQIEVKQLDGLYESLGANKRKVFLKLDVQGFEDRVLAGAIESIQKIRMVRMEMSIRPLYQSETLIDAMILKMRNLGFHLVAIEPNFADPNTGGLLQVDGLFAKI